MSRRSPTQPVKTSAFLWRWSLGLLLLGGWVGWHSATTLSIDELSAPRLVDQMEQLLVTGGAENLRARTFVRGGSDPTDAGGSGDAVLAHLTGPLILIDLCARSLAYLSSSPQQFPINERYLLPASREPPRV